MKQQDGKQRQARIEELEDYSASRWADPYQRNAELRKSFRMEKRARLERAERDASLRERIGWSEDIPLVGESSDDPALSTPVVRRAWHEAHNDRARPIKPRPVFKRKSRHPPMSAAARNLAGQILAPNHAKR